MEHVPARDPRRPALFFVVVLIHVGLISTLADSARTRSSRKRPEGVEPILVVFLDPAAVSGVPSPADDSQPPPLTAIDLSRASATPNVPEITAPADEPSAAPSSDWSAEMAGVARNAVARQAERDTDPRIGVHPEGMKRPMRPNHAPGETQDMGNGEILTWVDDYCFYSNRVKPRSNGIGGVKPLCVDKPPPYQSWDDWLKSRRKLADEREDE
jgi:hypothetical protein